MTCVEDKDRPHFEELLRRLGEVDSWLARIDPERADRPQEPPVGSPMRTDDERTHPYELSHAAWHALSHAVDPLNCLLALLRDAHMIHMFAPYSLVRSALENSSAAVWMLQPNSRTERLARRLRFATANIENSERVKQLIGAEGPRSKHELINEVRDIARRAGVDEAEAVRHVSYGEITKTVGSTLGLRIVIPVAWSLYSGIAHGDLWPTLSAATERVELPGAPPEMSTFKITANLQMLMYAVLTSSADWRAKLQHQRLSGHSHPGHRHVVLGGEQQRGAMSLRQRRVSGLFICT